MDVRCNLRGVLLPLMFLFLLACDKKPNKNLDLLRNQRPDGACEKQVIENEFIIKWKNGKITVHKDLSRSEFIEKILNKNENKIVDVEPNYKINWNRRNFQPSKICSQVNWGRDRIGVQKFWDANITGKDIIIAVTDTGLDYAHPALLNNLAYNEGELGFDKNGNNKRFNGLDDDKNGYIDDFAGYDFIYNEGIATDTVGHGTAVAGVIAAQHKVFLGQNGEDILVKGIAPGAKILPIKFIDEFSGGTADAIEAIRYAVKQGAQIINASWGGKDCSNILPTYMKSLEKKEILFVAASGNNNYDLDNLGAMPPVYPASLNLKNQITVGAIGTFGKRAGFSNFGELSVEMFAPGSSIYTISPDSDFTCADGTSFAAPMVSGALALLMEAYPEASHLEIKKMLLDSVEKDVDYPNLTQGSLFLGDLAPE